MQRRKPLRVDPAKTRAWQDRSRVRAAENARERPRTPLERGDAELERRTPLAPGRRKARERSPEERVAMARWHAAVVKGRACVGRGPHLGPVKGHHVIRQSVLETIAELLGWPYERVVWDVRLGIAVCEGEHDEHTRRHRRLAGALVPAGAWAAAEELDDALEAAGHLRTAIMELRREHP